MISRKDEEVVLEQQPRTSGFRGVTISAPFEAAQLLRTDDIQNSAFGYGRGADDSFYTALGQ
jgi:hypothetical protein